MKQAIAYYDRKTEQYFPAFQQGSVITTFSPSSFSEERALQIAEQMLAGNVVDSELPETLTEEQMTEIGGQLASDLSLKRDREHKDRFVTAWGTKTALGLYRTIYAMMNTTPKTHLGRNNR